MLLPISIHSWDKPWEAFVQTDETYAEILALIPNLPDERPKYGVNAIWVTADEMVTLKRLEIGFDIDKTELATKTGSMIVKLQDRLADRWPDVATNEVPAGEGLQGGQIVQLAIPDLGLLTLDEVTYMTDACTDMLQDELDKGWRILAVCPPNAQRRPDYILGRKKS